MTQPTVNAPGDTAPDAPLSVHVEAVPVVVVNEVKEQSTDAQLSSWSTYVMVKNGGSSAQPIIPQDRKRHRCIIIINGTAGDYVILSRQAQVSNNQGARLYVGNTIVLESESQVWVNGVAAVTNDVVVSVIDERYTPQAK